MSPKQGTLLYLLARGIGARRIVEYGTSFGVSTVYLASALRDNGGGTLIGSELEPAKVAAARRTLDEAGLADLVEIREGDARETLADPGGEIDLLFLDGFAPLYLPLLRLLETRLRPGALVVADNLLTSRRELRPYLDYLGDASSGFVSVSLWLKDGTHVALRL